MDLEGAMPNDTTRQRKTNPCMISLMDGSKKKLAHSWPAMAQRSTDDHHFEGLGLFSTSSTFFFLPASLPSPSPVFFLASVLLFIFLSLFLFLFPFEFV